MRILPGMHLEIAKKNRLVLDTIYTNKLFQSRAAKNEILTFNIWFCLIVSNGKLKMEHECVCVCRIRNTNQIHSSLQLLLLCHKGISKMVLNPSKYEIVLYENFIKYNCLSGIHREQISHSHIARGNCVTRWNYLLIHCFHWILSILFDIKSGEREKSWMEIIGVALHSVDDIISSSFLIWQYKWFIDSDFHTLLWHNNCHCDSLTVYTCTALYFIISLCWNEKNVQHLADSIGYFQGKRATLK